MYDGDVTDWVFEERDTAIRVAPKANGFVYDGGESRPGVRLDVGRDAVDEELDLAGLLIREGLAHSGFEVFDS
jgi:hypothetical protein